MEGCGTPRGILLETLIVLRCHLAQLLLPLQAMPAPLSPRPSFPFCCGPVDKLVARGRQLVAMYEEVGVERDRVLLRMPATWAAIQAGKQLETEGIACHLVLVYRWVEGGFGWTSSVAVQRCCSPMCQP